MSRTFKDQPKTKKRTWYIGKGSVTKSVKQESKSKRKTLKKLDVPTKGNYIKKVSADRWSYD